MGVRVRSTVKRSRELRCNMSDAEHKLWRVLRKRQLGGFRFRRQFPIGPYIVDFLCLEARLVIEVDGSQHDSEQPGRDAVREQWLKSQNFRVLRFWNNEVLTNLDGVTEKILQALSEIAPPSQPSPVKGEGVEA
jgi:very-short-patch-repair endonuclease